MLTGIDFFIVIAYLVGILLLGAYLKKFIKTSKDFFLGGRMLPFWAIGMSLVATDIGAVTLIGSAGQAFRFGVAVCNFDWSGCVLAMVLAAFILIPYYWRANVYTVPEYLGKRYNSSVRTFYAIIIILFNCFMIGVIFWSSAILLNTLMGIPIPVVIIIITVIVGTYTVMGGLSAIVMMDVVQMIIMYVGSATILILGLKSVGGPFALKEKILELGEAYNNHFSLHLPNDTATPYPWSGILFGLVFVLGNAYWIGDQKIVQRCLAAKNEWHAKASMIFGSFLKLFIPILIIIPGLIGVVLFPELKEGDQVIPVLIQKLLPPGLTGLVFAAFVAAMMSTVDSLLNATSTVWTQDIYKRLIKKDAPDSHYLLVGRLFTVAILLFGAITAPLSTQFPGVYVYASTLTSLFQGPILALILLGIFWARGTTKGGLTGFVSGVLVAGLFTVFKDTFFYIKDPFLFISWWSFVTSMVVHVGVSLLSKPKPRSQLQGLIFRLKGDINKGKTPKSKKGVADHA